MMRNRFDRAHSRRKISRKLAGLVVATSIAGSAAAAWAVCDQTSSSVAYQDLWKVHGCWNDFIQWEYRAYNMRDDDWGDRGWFNACDQNLEYAKHWNAAYLITYGLADDPGRSLHGTIDYRSTAEADDNNYHNTLNHKPDDDPRYYGHITTGWGEDELYTHCLVYDTSSDEGHPASAASTMIHEAWHSWGDKYDYDQGSNGGHQAGHTPNCTFPACDYFYWHGIGAYKFGDMWKSDGTAKQFHAVYQVEVEFMCDLIDSPKPWVPASVLVAAQASVNSRLAGNFINGPGYACGDPRPW
jgi:hypothetical protein